MKNSFEVSVNELKAKVKGSELIADLLMLLEANKEGDRNQPAERSFIRKTIEAALSAIEEDKQVVKTVAFILYKERLQEVNEAV